MHNVNRMYKRRIKKAGKGYFLPYDFVCVTFVILKQCISMCVCRCSHAHLCADACVCVCVHVYMFVYECGGQKSTRSSSGVTHFPFWKPGLSLAGQ